MKGHFVFTNPFWIEQLGVPWIVYAALIPIEIALAIVVFRGVVDLSARISSVVIGTGALISFMLVQAWFYMTGVEKCHCFGASDLPPFLLPAICLFLAMFGIFFLFKGRFAVRDATWIPIRLDVVVWSVLAFVACVYFICTDSGQVLAGFKSPNTLKFRLL